MRNLITHFTVGILALLIGVFIVLVATDNRDQQAPAASPDDTYNSADVPLRVGALAFDGQPTSPQSFFGHAEYGGYDVQVHSRDLSTFCDDCLESMRAQHGPDCAGNAVNSAFPEHEIHEYRNTVFVCKDHLMTALKTAGYGVIYLTPDRLLDWTNGPAIVTWDMSTHETSQRDWVDLWLQPWENNTALPLEGWLPDLGNIPGDCGCVLDGRQYLHLRGGPGKNWHEQRDQVSTLGPNLWWVNYQADSKAVRDTFQLTIDRGTYSFCKITGEPGGAPLCWADHAAHHLSMTQAVVSLGHHSYNPEKDCGTTGVDGCEPNTWHWDNITLAPNAPFTIIHANERALFGSGGNFTFGAPAPAGSFIHFAAVGDVFVNGQHVAATQNRIAAETARSFFVPIPTGARSVQIALRPSAEAAWYNGPFIAQDASIWSRGSAPPQPTPTPLPPTPTQPATQTPAPTFTPGPAPSSTPKPPATSTPPGPSPTKTKTPTRTPTVDTRLCQRVWGTTPVATYGRVPYPTCVAVGR